MTPTSYAGRRTVAEIVDLAFNLIRPHYATFVLVSALAMMPVLLLTVVAGPVPLLRSILVLVCAGWAEAGLLLGMAAAYRGEAVPDAVSQLRAGTRIAGRVIRIGLTRNIAAALGLVLLIIPGLLVLAYYFLAAPAAALEDLRAGAAMRRGGELAQGEYGRIIGVSLLVGIIYFLMASGLSIALLTVTNITAVEAIGSTVMQILGMPVFVALMVAIYYDIRDRREGLDIELALMETPMVSEA